MSPPLATASLSAWLRWTLSPIRGLGRRVRQSKLRFMFVGGEYDPASRGSSRSPLQRHVDYFDEDADGVLTLAETARGLRRLGLADSAVRAWFFAGGIHLVAGRKTWQTWLPALTVNTDAIGLALHGSATGVFLPDGSIDHDRMDELFSRYSRDGVMTRAGLRRLLLYDRQKGWSWDEIDGRMQVRFQLPVVMKMVEGTGITRNEWREFYSGTLFPTIATDRRERTPLFAADLDDPS